MRERRSGCARQSGELPAGGGGDSATRDRCALRSPPPRGAERAVQVRLRPGQTPPAAQCPRVRTHCPGCAMSPCPHALPRLRRLPQPRQRGALSNLG